jgi:hypothetical protein
MLTVAIVSEADVRLVRVIWTLARSLDIIEWGMFLRNDCCVVNLEFLYASNSSGERWNQPQTHRVPGLCDGISGQRAADIDLVLTIVDRDELDD